MEFPLFGFVSQVEVGFASLDFFFAVAAGFLAVPWWNSLCLVLCARVCRL